MDNTQKPWNTFEKLKSLQEGNHPYILSGVVVGCEFWVLVEPFNKKSLLVVLLFYGWIYCRLFNKDYSLYSEKAMAPHSSTPAWKIPWTEEPGRLWSMGSRRVRHNWATSLWLFTFTHWRRKWQPSPVFLPGESQGRGSLVGCCLWGRTESDTTEAT